MTNEQFNNYYDVFHSFLVTNADYDGYFEMPKIKTSIYIPNRVVTFSKAMAKNMNDFDQWVLFYEHDKNFERLWNNPRLYLNRLKNFRGIISPDFSLYRNMPLCMQLWNTYRGRALSSWLQRNGIEVIPNVRWGDERTYNFCFDGIERNKTIAIGTHGCIRGFSNREHFINGMNEMMKRLLPKNIIVYGDTPHDIFEIYIKQGVQIIAFESEIRRSRKRVIE